MAEKHFIKKVEILGLNVKTGRKYNRRGEYFFIINKDGYSVADVSRENLYEINTSHYFFNVLEEWIQINLLKILNEFSQIPVNLRHEEKKYIYEFPTTITSESGDVKSYHIVRALFGANKGLKLDNSGKEFALNEESFQFTDKQVKEYSENIEYKHLFEMCKKIEVETDE